MCWTHVRPQAGVGAEEPLISASRRHTGGGGDASVAAQHDLHEIRRLKPLLLHSWKGTCACLLKERALSSTKCISVSFNHWIWCRFDWLSIVFHHLESLLLSFYQTCWYMVISVRCVALDGTDRSNPLGNNATAWEYWCFWGKNTDRWL